MNPLENIFGTNIILENERVLLRPLQPDDILQFSKIAFEPEIWAYLTNLIRNEEDLNLLIEQTAADKKRGFRYPFTIEDKFSANIAGSTSYGNISPQDNRLEIGWTWLGKDFMGTGLNNNCKYLLLQYAFENLGCERVEFKTDVLNKRSRQALKKIGAAEEGILRSHMLMHGGRRRDSVYYSILKNEWEEVKKKLALII
ncbi:MAG: N-acetyltransferase [Ignavibacteriae bacterium]|nr:MAG: N-acetyltransferase [Ignavibacteriota bacterium]